MNTSDRFAFLRGRGVVALNLLLLVQAAGFYAFSRRELAPPVAPLTSVPSQIGEWRFAEDFRLDAEIQRILHPDDYIIRTYSAPTGASLSLLVAYFRTQTTGQGPHSPQNCLPGQGWAIQKREVASIQVPATGESILVNRYSVFKDNDRSVVLYWYHGPSRVIANEYRARLQLVLDSLRYRRSDTALVRITVPVIGDDEAAAERRAVSFAQALHPLLRRHIPLI
jgi:EpsI family protein